ncbi:MAG: T9SS type A sorting domain-containing protein [Chitinophagaceae bacterium]
MKSILSLLLLVLSCATGFATARYVSPTGLDTNPGTFELPYKTITKGVSSSVAGDTIYLRGGNHVYSTKISISKVGTAVNRFYLLAYPGEKPVLDFSSMAFSSSNRGLELSGSYWTIRGMDFYKAGDNGMFVSGGFNIIAICNFYENQDTGLQLANGANNNQMINCDSYFNVDPAQGNADGFAAKLDVGTGNSFKGCRSWQNSDDGWDGLLTTGLGTNPATTYDSCWCFMNGYLKSGVASSGNGNGFKMGGNSERHDATLTRCLSAFNRVKGFDQNNDLGSMILYNCTGYKNKPNFGMNNFDPAPGEVMIVKNCISYLSQATDVFRAVATLSNNSWQSPFVTNAADFVSVDSMGLRAPRKADGSLPDINFMMLASSSDLIDGGVNVGLPYNGAAPDLGAFETNYALPVSLLSFTVLQKENTVELHWTTATEIQNKGWEIERTFVTGTTVAAWQNLGFVNGHGNTVAVSAYLFTDASLSSGTYQYRLKQVDADGHFKYSPIVSVTISGKKGLALSLYPNPVKGNATIHFFLPETTAVTWTIFDAAGHFVKLISDMSLDAGEHSRLLEAAGLSQGKYVLTMLAGSQSANYPFLVAH